MKTEKISEKFGRNLPSLANKTNTKFRTNMSSCVFCTLMESTSNKFLKNELFAHWVSNDI